MASKELEHLFNKYEYLTDAGAGSSADSVTVGGRSMPHSLAIKLLCKEVESLRGNAAPTVALTKPPEPPQWSVVEPEEMPPPPTEPTPVLSVPEPVAEERVKPIGEPLRPFDHEFDILIADDVATRGYLKNLKVILDTSHHPLGDMCAAALEQEDSLLNYRLVTFAIQGSAEKAHIPGAETGGTFGRSMAGGQTYRGQPLHCWAVIAIGNWSPILTGDMPGPFITGLLGHIGEASHPVCIHIMYDVLVAEIAPHLPEVIEYRNKVKAANSEAHNKLQMQIKSRQAGNPTSESASKTDMEEFKEFQRWKAMVKAREA